MKNLIRALAKSIIDLFHPKILLLMFLPPILALLFWGGVAFFFWPRLMETANWIISWAPDFLQVASSFIAVILAIGMVLPLAIASVLIFTAVVAMPIIVPHVAKNYFPELKRNPTGNFRFVFTNVFSTTGKYLVMWFLTLPLWLVPGLHLALPLVLNAYLNYKLFLYDALGERATPFEISELVQLKRSEFYVLGLITAFLMMTPIIFFVAPFYTGLAFTHMSFAELKDYRLEQSKKI